MMLYCSTSTACTTVTDVSSSSNVISCASSFVIAVDISLLSSSLMSFLLLPHHCCPHRCCFIVLVLNAFVLLLLLHHHCPHRCCFIVLVLNAFVLLLLPHLCGLNVSVMVPVLPPCHCFDRIRSVGQEYQRNWDVPDSLPPVHDNGNQT